MKKLILSLLFLMQSPLSHAGKDHGGGDTFLSRYLIQLDAVEHAISLFSKESDLLSKNQSLIDLYLENRKSWVDALAKVSVKVRMNDLDKLAIVDENAVIYLDTDYMKKYSVTSKEVFINVFHELGHIFTNFDHDKLDEMGHLIATNFFEKRSILSSNVDQKRVSEDRYMKAVSNLFLDELGEIIVSKKNKYYLKTQWMDVEGRDGVADVIKLDKVRTRIKKLKANFFEQNPILRLPRENIIKIESDVVCLESEVEYVYYSGYKNVSQSFSKTIDAYKDFYPTYSKFITGHRELKIDYFYRVPRNKCLRSKLIARATLKMIFDPKDILEMLKPSNSIAEKYNKLIKEIRTSAFFTAGTTVKIGSVYENSVHEIIQNLNAVLPKVREMMIDYGHRTEVRDLSNAIHDRIQHHIKVLRISLSHIKRPIRKKDRSKTSHVDLSNDKKLSLLEGALIEVESVQQVKSKLMQIISSSKVLRDISLELFEKYSYDTEVFLLGVAKVYPELQVLVDESLSNYEVSRNLRREIFSKLNSNVLVFRGLLERAAPEKIIEAIISQKLLW